MKTVDFKIGFSPIVEGSVKTKLYENVKVITVNGGGGMGGSREHVYCEEITEKDDLGFIKVVNLIDNVQYSINPRYISKIKTVNVSVLTFKHENTNFKGDSRTEIYSHSTELKPNFTIGCGETTRDNSQLELLLTK